MKPCPRNRKLLVWLALDTLEAEPARALRAHLETCAPCRDYLRDLATVQEKLTALEPTPELQPSPAFRRRWMAALEPERPRSPWFLLAENLSHRLRNWRVAVPALGAAAVLFLVFSTLWHSPKIPRPIRGTTLSAPRRDLAPTASNYRLTANRSFEQFDELLTRQAAHNLPPAPTYTASLFAPARELE